MSLSAPPRPGWIDYVWLFRLLLELPPPTGGRGGGTCLPNLPKYLQQQSCPGQPSAVPSREDKLSVLWQHIFQHFQLEQACEEASHRFIASRLLTHVEKYICLTASLCFSLWNVTDIDFFIGFIVNITLAQAIGTRIQSKVETRHFNVRSALSGSRPRMPSQNTSRFTRARQNVITARPLSRQFPTLTSMLESTTVTKLIWMSRAQDLYCRG